jgi:hypothetical protein
MPLRIWSLLLLSSATLSAYAQSHTPPGQTSLGGMLGDPSGVTLKVYSHTSFTAYDFLLAWDLDRFFFFNAHGLYERPLPDSPLNYFLGPGILLGVREHPRQGNDVVLGFSGNFGLNFFVERLEIFLQLMPRLHVIPETEGDIGGGVGVRYYFGGP